MFLLILPSPLFLHHVQVLDVKEYFFPFGFWLVRFLFCCSAGGFFSNNASIDFCFICSLFPPHSSKQAAASSRQSKKWSLEWVDFCWEWLKLEIEMSKIAEVHRQQSTSRLDMPWPPHDALPINSLQTRATWDLYLRLLSLTLLLCIK